MRFSLRRRLAPLALVVCLCMMLLSGVASGTSHTFTLTNPTANSVWVTGSTMNIQWTGGNPNWSVYLSLIDVPNWVVATTIVLSTPNTGSYTWTVPPGLPAGTYQVYIQESSGATWTYGPSFTVVREEQRPELTIAKKPEGELVAGQTGTYQIVVANVGAGQANGPITVTDYLGANLAFVSAAGNGWTCTGSGQTVTCTHPGPLPPGQSLPPITLTVTVAGDVKEVENCASVGDAKTCVTTPVEPAPRTGSICGVKFDDANGNGIQDPGEPGLPGWTIELQDANGNLVATVVTGPNGEFCFKGLRPDKYTVSEVNQPGWSQTYPAGGTHTVAVSGDQVHVKDVSFGNHAKEDPGIICGVKFEDVNGNGIQDPGEPGLAGWTIQMKDGAGNLVSTTVSGKDGKFCFENLRPGVYTFAEVLKPNWTRTFPTGAGTHTVTVVGGHNQQTIAFGNLQKPEPCCLTFRFPAGKADDFSAQGLEAAAPGAALLQSLGSYSLAQFDGTAPNKFFAHTVTLPQGNCLKSAKLELKARPLPDIPGNDTLALRFTGVAGSPVFGSYFGSGNANPGLLANQWQTATYPNGYTFSFDLANLPGGGSLLPWLNTQRFLDIVVQDDTSIDYLVLTAEFCECGGPHGPMDVDAAHAMSRAGAALPVSTEQTVIKLVVGAPEATVNGETRRLPAAAASEAGTTLVPLRWIGEALGAQVAWDPAERKVTYVLGDRTVELWVGQTRALVNGQEVALPVAPLLRGGSTLVPVRFVGEALGAGVVYDPVDRTITITYPR